MRGMMRWVKYRYTYVKVYRYAEGRDIGGWREKGLLNLSGTDVDVHIFEEFAASGLKLIVLTVLLTRGSKEVGLQEHHPRMKLCQHQQHPLKSSQKRKVRTLT